MGILSVKNNLVIWLLLMALTSFGQTLSDPAFLSRQVSSSSAPSLDPSLVLFYKFTEGTGITTADATTNANNGTFTGAPTWTTYSAGVGALLFNGTSQSISCGAGSSLSVTACSISCWINLTSLGAGYMGVVSKSSAGYPINQTIYVKSNGKLAMYIQASSNPNYDGTGTHTLTTATWYHLCLTYDSVHGLVGYVNGAVDGTSGANGALVTGVSTTVIGNDPYTGGRFLSGSVAGVMIFNRALTAGEVATIAASSPIANPP